MTLFDFRPVLRGRLIEVRPLEPDDFEPLFAAASDPLVWEQHPEQNRFQRDVFLRFFDGAIASQGAFAVIDRASGAIIGSTRYYAHDVEKREIMIGYTFLARAFWGGSYNRELKQLMLNHAFQFVDRVLFEVGEDNLRSQKALENIGARVAGKTELKGLDGLLRPHVIFMISRPS